VGSVGLMDEGMENSFTASFWPPGGGAPGRPLSGVRVIELSRILAGPYCTMLLADLGADVLKIEAPGGDETRRWGPPFVGETAAYFSSANRNKRSIVLDLKDGSARSTLGRLVAEADVVIHNYTDQVSARLGIERQWLLDQNPDCVICRISGFGESSSYPAYDLVLQAASGLMAITGHPDGEPTKVGVAVADVAAGLFAALGILAELYARRQHAGGRQLDISLLDSSLALLVNQGASWLADGGEPQRLGNDHPSIVPYGLFSTGDGQMVLAVGSDRQFGALCQVLGAPDLCGDIRFATNPRRVAHRAELRAVLETLLSSASAEEWHQRLERAEVPCGRVQTVGEALSTVGSHLLTRVPQDDGPAQGQVMSPIRIDGEYLHPYRAAPALGQHTGELVPSSLDGKSGS
jgi:crotonobetainyl-CoA:carnitine CoA-transferase CaiB-like acyl-CoA transferase